MKYDHLRVAAALAMLGVIGGTAEAKPARPVRALNCQPLPDAIVKGDGLYIGEIHGTREIPTLVLCLTRQALRQRSGPVVVSLEQEASGSPRRRLDWEHPSDGRTSQAMYALIVELEAMAAHNPRLTIDSQDGCPLGSAPADYDAVINGCMGLNLRIAARDRFLIAYSGNSHARRSESPYRTAASFLPASIKTVDVITSQGGTMWGIYNGAQGTANILPRSDLAGIDGFTESRDPGFDYYYVIGKITASPPANKVP